MIEDDGGGKVGNEESEGGDSGSDNKESKGGTAMAKARIHIGRCSRHRDEKIAVLRDKNKQEGTINR